MSIIYVYYEINFTSLSLVREIRFRCQKLASFFMHIAQCFYNISYNKKKQKVAEFPHSD